MPQIDETLNNDNLARLLVYGNAKTRKTWWATMAAELGFNVILADIDYGFHVVQNLTPAARRRIYHLDMRPPVDDFKDNGALCLVHAMQGKVTFYDEATRRYTPRRKLDPEGKYAVLDFTKLTNRDVLIIDSWTELVTQVVAADQSVLDPTAVSKLEWDDYQKYRLLLDLFLANMAKLNCHVIVIGHAETVGKRKKDAPAKAKPEEAYESIRLQPMSVSRSHAETLASKFTDVLYFSVPNAMTGTMINTKGSADFDAGSRRVAPSLSKFADLTFAHFIPGEMLESIKNNGEYSSQGCVAARGADLAVELAESKPAISVGKSPITITKRNTQ